MKIEFTKEIFNDVYLPTYIFKGRYLILWGSAGSGKSEWAAQKILLRSLTETPHRFLMLRKVARSIKGSQYQLFRDIVSRWGLDKFFEFKEMHITYLPNGNELLFAGLDDPEKLKSITRITGTWIEEPTELEEDDFKQIDLRMRGETKNYLQHILTLNPIDDEHWIKHRFFTS
jgi:phage terminase large subunit